MIGLLFVFGMSAGMGYATDYTTADNDIGYEVSVEVPTSDVSVMNVVTAEPLVFTNAFVYVEMSNSVAVAFDGIPLVPDKGYIEARSNKLAETIYHYPLRFSTHDVPRETDFKLTPNRNKFIDRHRLN